MKNNRKVIIAIVLPAYAFVFTCIFAESRSIRGGAFEFDTTWWIWLLFISAVAYWMDLIFARKRK